MRPLEWIFPLGIPLAWRNLVKEKKRFVAAIAGITFAVTMMLFQLGLHSALFEQVVSPHLKLKADLVMVNQQYEYIGISRTFNERRLIQAMSAPEVIDVTSLYLTNLPIKNPLTGVDRDIFIFGFNPARKIFDDSQITSQQDALKIPGSALFDVRSHEQFGNFPEILADSLSVRTEINDESVKVVGTFAMGATFAADGNLIVSRTTFFQIFPGSPSEVSIGLIDLEDGADPIAVAKTLNGRLLDDVLVMTREDFIEQERTYWGERTPIGFVITASMFVSIIVGAVIVYQILYTDVTDHLEEYATLKSIGFRDNYFTNLILQESIILSLFGFLPGVGFAAVLYKLTREIAYMPTYMTWFNALLVLVLTMIMCLIAGLLATRKLRQSNPAEIF